MPITNGTTSIISGLSFPGASLPITNGAQTWTLTTDNSHGVSGSELLMTVTGPDNVLSIRNNDATAGKIAGLTFRAADNGECGAIGYGNGSGSFPFSGTVFVESSNIFGVSGPTVSKPIAFVQTYRDAGNGIVWNERLRIVDRGAFTINKNGAWPSNEAAVVVASDGTVKLNPASGRVRVGFDEQAVGPAFANFGALQLIQPPNTATCFSITQDTVASAQFGFAANSSTLIIGADGSEIAFASSPGGALTGTRQAGLILGSGYFWVNGGVSFGGFGGPGVFAAAGNPNGAVSAAVGSLCTSSAGGAGTTLYVKESGGGGNTGWVAK